MSSRITYLSTSIMLPSASALCPPTLRIWVSIDADCIVMLGRSLPRSAFTFDSLGSDGRVTYTRNTVRFAGASEGFRAGGKGGRKSSICTFNYHTQMGLVSAAPCPRRRRLHPRQWRRPCRQPCRTTQRA